MIDPKMVAELAALGIYIVPIDEPDALHRLIAGALNEEHQLDYLDRKANKEWTK